MTDSVAFGAPAAEDRPTDSVAAVTGDRRTGGEDVVADCEERVAEACERTHAVVVDSGAAAIYLALRAAGVGPGDEVIVPSLAAFDAVSPIVELGADPAFVDVDPVTCTLDTDHAARVADRNADVAAIVPVHLYGHPCRMRAVGRIARRNDLAVVADARRAHGATREGDPVASLGDVGCLSLRPLSDAPADGGVIVTDDGAVARRVRRLRDRGRDERGEHVLVGLDHRLDEFGAAVGLDRFRRLRERIDDRVRLAERYRDRLEGVRAISPPRVPRASEHACLRFVVRTPDRAALRAHLADAGIETRVHHGTPVHRTTAMERTLEEPPTLPRTERLAGELLSLPLHAALTDAEVDRVCDAIERFFE